MKATFMVPKEHIAIRMWRKTVNHFVNAAPLWNQKEKLMIAINNGIKKIAFNLHKQHRRLSIYTAVRKLVKNKVKGIWVDVQKPNVWFKLLYEEKNKLAAMVVIHNDPKGPPKTDKACLVPMDCKTMKDWNAQQHQKQQDPGVLLDDLEYAYCCDPKPEEIESIFKMHLEKKGGLDLDKNFENNYESFTHQAPGSPSTEMTPPTYDTITQIESDHPTR